MYTMQLATTMNVDCDPLLDWAHLGLQFQIEHHLFPRLPRHNLREARKLVRPVCEKYGLEYVEPGFVEGNVAMYSQLKKAGYAASKAGKIPSGRFAGYYKGSAIAQGLNLSG